jgi:hypothetical protein
MFCIDIYLKMEDCDSGPFYMHVCVCSICKSYSKLILVIVKNCITHVNYIQNFMHYSSLKLNFRSDQNYL